MKPRKEKSEQNDKGRGEVGWVWTAGSGGVVLTGHAPHPVTALQVMILGCCGACLGSPGRLGAVTASHCEQLQRTRGRPGYQVPGPRVGGMADVPWAFFVENYCAVVNVSLILSRARLGGKGGGRGEFLGGDTRH